MRRALNLVGCLLFVSLVSGNAFGQETYSESSATALDVESKSIQQDLLESRIVDVKQEANTTVQTAPDLNIKELAAPLPMTRPAGIGYPLLDSRTETPKGKIYPSQSERDVVVGMLLTAAFQKVLP